MQTLWIARNPLDLKAWEAFATEDVIGTLRAELPVWPKTARIYHGEVTQEADVTPKGDADVEKLKTMKEPLYVVVYPAAAQVLGAAAVYAVAFVVSALMADHTPKPREQLFYNGSPNNQLSERRNQARVNQRVPDGYGVIRSVPDLIQYSYITYANHFPIENSLMCIGRGDYAVSEVRDSDINFNTIRDAAALVFPPGQTPGIGTPNLVIGQIFTEPVYTVIPITAINHQPLPPLNAFKCHGTGRNGRARNLGTNSVMIGAGTLGDWTGMIFRNDGVIIVPTNGDPDYVHSRIRVGDELQVAWGTMPSTPFTPTGGLPAGLATPPDLSAGWAFGIAESEPHPATVGYPANGRVDLETLTVTDVTTLNVLEVAVTVTIPSSLQFQWDRIQPYCNWTHNGVPAVLNKNAYITAQNRWVIGYRENQTGQAPMGLFIDDPNCTEIWMNFVAPRGLYIEDGANRKTLTETLAWFIQPCDINGTPTADPGESGNVQLKGSLIGGETRAVTVKFPRVTPGRCLLIVCRTSNRVRQEDLDPKVTDFFRPPTFDLTSEVVGDPDAVFTAGVIPSAFTGNVTDDIEFSECYSMSIPQFQNGNFTLVQTRTVHNASAARVQERQVNCLAGRAIQVWTGSGFTTLPEVNEDAENILFAVMQDKFIGNRGGGEIDFVGIAATFQAIRDYFGDDSATSFSYTFDDFNTSFEETVAIIAQACFAVPYRQGQLLKCDPEIATDVAVGLFNHRNKVPLTEARTVTFGIIGDNDGVEQVFTNVDTGQDTYIPISQIPGVDTPVAPLQSRVVGLRFKHQAAWHAYRQLARMTYQHTAVEFDATEEASTLGLKQRILVEDNTRPDVQDGHIESVSGLTIRTSQPSAFEVGATYTLFVWYTDGSVQGIPVTAGGDEFELVLGSAPAVSLVTDTKTGVQTNYILVKDQSSTGKAFLVTSKDNTKLKEYKIQAVNYSHMYYHADGLILWLPVSNEVSGEEMFDRSPYGLPNNGTIADTSVDAIRGLVYNGTNASAGILVNSNTASAITVGYTKTCWVKKADGTNRGPILESTTDDEELFEVAGAVVLRAGHSGTFHVTYTNPTSIVDEWVHCAVTYDVASGTMRLYFNGDMVDEATGVPNRTNASLTAFRSQNGTFAGRLIGQADSLRHYARVLSPAMIREMYQKELMAA